MSFGDSLKDKLEQMRQGLEDLLQPKPLRYVLLAAITVVVLLLTHGAVTLPFDVAWNASEALVEG